MSPEEQRLRQLLAKIADEARIGINGDGDFDDELGGDNASEQSASDHTISCTLKFLPPRLLVQAARTAIRINPVNAPVVGPLAALDDGISIAHPQAIAVLTSKYWGPTPRRLTVSFMESTPADLKKRILSHMNAWNTVACISFVSTSGVGDVRISRGPGGYWSYLGTDILHIPKNRQTMNLESFTMNTIESEYKRVVRHETGHTMGFPHEHMRKALVARIDPEKAYRWFLQTYGWDRTTVDQQVLTALDERSLMGTPVDQTSIMCYQLPGQITYDGKPITGGTDINATDYGFAGKIYPKAGHAPLAGHAPVSESADAWSEMEDVEVSV